MDQLLSTSHTTDHAWTELLNTKDFPLSTLYSLSHCCYSLVMDVCKLPSLAVQSKRHTTVKLMFPDTDLRARESGLWSQTALGWKPSPSFTRCVVLSKLLTQSSGSIHLSSVKQGLVLQRDVMTSGTLRVVVRTKWENAYTMLGT